jgi:mannose-6-phosphate isomerase-like protein (cupin superfamily)
MSDQTKSQRSAIVFNLADAPSNAMRYDRGTQYKLFGPHNGAVNADIHINVIKLDSGLGPYHFHERAENFYIVLDGKVEVIVEGVRHLLGKDDVAFIPPGLRHCAGTAAESSVPARVIEIYAPAGTDFNIVGDSLDVIDSAPDKP